MRKKKKIYTYVFGYFPIACVKKKMYICIFLGDFPTIKKKKFCSKSAETVLGHCPNYIVIREIILQEET